MSELGAQDYWIAICVAIGMIFYLSVDEPSEPSARAAIGFAMALLIWGVGNFLVLIYNAIFVRTVVG